MLREIGWKRFLEWRDYADLEPFDRDTWQLAHVAQLLFNIHRDPKKHKDGLPLGEFLLKFDEEPKHAMAVQRQQTPEEMMRIIDGWVLVNNLTLEQKTT